MQFTKEQLIAKAREQITFCRHTKITGEGRTHVNQCLALFEIALASLNAEIHSYTFEEDPHPLYTAPPAPVDNIHPLLEFAREYIESWDFGMAGDSSLLASAKQAIADSSAQQLAPVSVPDERAAFNAWNNDTDCPLAGRDAKTAAWLAWSRRAAMLNGEKS